MAEDSEMSLDRGWDTDVMNEYRQVRIDSRQFAVVAEHFIGEIERIVFENGRFAVAMKRDGHTIRCCKGRRSRWVAGGRWIRASSARGTA